MMLSLRSLAPYLCDAADLEILSFETIPKRQLISPLDLSFTHRKHLRILTSDGQGKPAYFSIKQRNELDIGKALLKVTFSDVVVLQTASTRLFES